jgi:uncharacterized protein YeaO (DUF488 family)
MIQVKRAYDPVSAHDGARFLVERLWPRGVRKEDLHIEAWVKDVAPSTELRKWFQHDPTKWNRFRQRYFRELDKHREVWDPLLNRARSEHVTLIYSARDTEHNNAVALQEFLEKQIVRSERARRAA